MLEVRGLTVSFRVDDGHAPDVHAVRGVSFDVLPGEVLAVVGESGSGKSVTSLALLGLLGRHAVVGGSARLGGPGQERIELLGLDRHALQDVRGRRVAMVFQDSSGALDPVFTIGFQLDEMLRRHAPDLSRTQRRDRAVELLAMVELPDPAERLRFYPHQLSGGQAQRVMIAMALACDPEVLLADEPTTALDVTVQREVLDVLRRLRERVSTSIVLITHDMGVVADLADRVVVMRGGEVVETAPVRQLFDAPRAAYTRQLLAAVPRVGTPERPSGAIETDRPALAFDELVVEYRDRRGKAVRAVDGVTLSVRPGEIVALVGESGSGKSSMGRCALGLAPVTSGTVEVVGTRAGHDSPRAVRAARARVGVVFQNPAASLNPRYSIGESVAEPLLVHAGLRGAELERRTAELLESVELPAAWVSRVPARALGRPAPAGVHRAGDLPGSGPAHRRRADVGPGRLRAGHRAGGVPGGAADPRLRLPVHQPRPRGGGRARRPRRRPAPGPAGRDGRADARARPAGAGVHPAAAGCGSRAGPGGAGGAAGGVGLGAGPRGRLRGVVKSYPQISSRACGSYDCSR